MAKMSLGKGLDALFPSNVNVKTLGDEPDVSNESVIEMKINNIEPNVNQPRKNFDDEKIDDLAESIKVHGVLQPIIVCKKGDYYQIIAGERRWRASKKAGLKTIPVIIREYDEQKTREVALIENLQRQDLNALETAKAIKELMEEHSLTQEEISKTLGKSRSSIANTLRILNLDDRVQDLVANGKISEGHARTLASIPNAQKQYKLAMDIINLDLNVREAEERSKYAKEEIVGKTKIRKKETIGKLDIVYKDIENRLKEALGTKVSFKPITKSKGKISIEYFSSDELDRILDILENNDVK